MNWADIPRNPSERTLRQFAAIWLIAFGAFAVVQFLRGHEEPAVALAILAVAVAIPGLARPRLVKMIFVGWMILTFPLGWLISNVALLILFYAIFTPVGLVMRLFGRDALGIRPKTEDSYWRERPQAKDVEQYFRQS